MEMSIRRKENNVLVILSPSKTMDMSGAIDLPDYVVEEKTEELLKKLRTFSPEELSKAMKIKGKTLDSVVGIYKNYSQAPCKRALDAYSGFVFREIHLDTEEDKEYAYRHFAVLSALYGLVPADRYIREYRLDMTIKVLEENPYTFWKDHINEALISYMEEIKDAAIINLASTEFSKLLDRKRLPGDIFDIDFKEEKDGKFKSVSAYAKKARGLMSNYIIKNKIERPEDLKGFSLEGYTFNEDLSSEKKFIFTR